MSFNVEPLFQIASVGIIVAIIHTVLKQSGKEDFAQWVTLIGFVIILLMVISYIGDLFEEIKRVFLFY